MLEILRDVTAAVPNNQAEERTLSKRNASNLTYIKVRQGRDNS